MSCAKIELSSDACQHKRIGGTFPRAFGFNADDIDGYHETTNMPIMKEGTTGYVYTGFKDDSKPNCETINLGTGPDVFKHNFSFMVYDKSQNAKDKIVKPIVQGRTVWIYEANGKDANSFQILGRDAGLQNVPGVIQNPFENLGVWLLTLATADTEFEDDPPKTVLVTDYDTTLAAIEALVAPVP